MDRNIVIEDLAAEGETLTDDQLRLVSGGMRSQYSKTLDLAVGICDIDCAF